MIVDDVQMFGQYSTDVSQWRWLCHGVVRAGYFVGVDVSPYQWALCVAI